MNFLSLAASIPTRVSQRKTTPLTDDEAAALKPFLDALALPFAPDASASVYSCATDPSLAKFPGQSHFVAIVAPATDAGRLQAGFVGELIALEIERLRMGCCWVALFNHAAVYKAVFGGKETKNEIDCVLTLGKGTLPAVPVQRKRKTTDECLHKQSLKTFPAPLRKALDDATQAPSAVNFQTWSFIVKQLENGFTLDIARTKHLLGDKNAHTYTNAGIAAAHAYVSLCAQGIPCAVSIQQNDGDPVFRFVLTL